MQITIADLWNYALAVVAGTIMVLTSLTSGYKAAPWLGLHPEVGAVIGVAVAVAGIIGWSLTL